MILEVSKLWVAAGIALGKDPTTSVPCPECGQHNLIVRDIPFEDENVSGFERLMQCPECGAHNYLLHRQPVARTLVIASIRQTSQKSPAQWEGRLADHRPFYIRYRWGYLSVSLGTENAPVSSAVDGIEWFGKQLEDKLAGTISFNQVCEKTGLRMQP